tara:strand:+ start:7807 stop:9318 length:1512 start_codon:yes stop_codon:yes gene_type:complete
LPQETALDKLVKRRHPDYDAMKPHWDFVESTYRGGRAWFKDNVFKYHKEGRGEYRARVNRAYRFNHSREVVNLVSKYIFKGEILRNDEGASEVLRDFWHCATRDGQDISQFMRLVDTKSSTFGRIWVMTDSTATGGTKNLADQREQDARIYAYIVRPQNVLDVGYDRMGVPLWVLFLEHDRDDTDPLNCTGDVIEQYRLWTRNEWMLFQASGDEHDGPIVQVASGVHGLGVVPGFPVDHMGVSEDLYHSPSLINDIAYLDRAVANYLSNLDAIIQDQTFSQLAMPAQNISAQDDTYKKLLELGTKRIFVYDGGEGGNKPHYLSPDPTQAELIITVIKTIINEIYHTVGMAGERTKQDNAVGIDNSSGVAKAYDFERVNSLLASKAATLNRAENRLAQLVDLWTGKPRSRDLDRFEPVTYPKDFDVRGLFDDIEIASRLSLLNAPQALQQSQMDVVARKLFPQMSRDLKARLKQQINDWPTDPAEQDPAGNSADQPGAQTATAE